MYTRFTLNIIAVSACLMGTGGAFAQHAGAAILPASPYAGQQTREIKALSSTQAADLLAGKGMEQAKAAELNGYPGPMHVLELATQLDLTAEQKQASEELMSRHKADARDLGARLVEAERALDQAFSSRQIDAAQLAIHTGNLGRLQALLRQSHLHTHLLQTALLRPEQISRYAQLRAYSPATGPATAPSPSIHRHQSD